jgi:hypothetical protein
MLRELLLRQPAGSGIKGFDIHIEHPLSKSRDTAHARARGCTLLPSSERTIANACGSDRVKHHRADTIITTPQRLAREDVEPLCRLFLRRELPVVLEDDCW